MRFDSDVDIDLGNRDRLLDILPHVRASIREGIKPKPHATGVHVTSVPFDPFNNQANLDYRVSEERGYFKLDLLNVFVYDQIEDEEHLLTLMREPNWKRLKERAFVLKLVHLGSNAGILNFIPDPVDSIEKLAMLLAVMRPAKKHLVGLKWDEVAKTVWSKEDGVYGFKRSHAISYAWLVAVHMNLIEEQEKDPDFVWE